MKKMQIPPTVAGSGWQQKKWREHRGNSLRQQWNGEDGRGPSTRAFALAQDNIFRATHSLLRPSTALRAGSEWGTRTSIERIPGDSDGTIKMGHRAAGGGASQHSCIQWRRCLV